MTATRRPGVRCRSVGASCSPSRPTTPRRRRGRPDGPWCGCRRPPRPAVSVTAGCWSSSASRRTALPWARARSRIVSTSGARASPTATGTTTRRAATGPPVTAGSTRRAVSRVATAVATSSVAATRARPRLCRRTTRRSVSWASASQPAAVSDAPMACSSAAWRATRSLIRSTSARASSSSSRERDSSTQASQQVTATATSRPASTIPTAGSNHAVSRTATSPARALEISGTVTRTWASTTSVRSSTTPVSTLERDRRPRRAGVSGTSAAYTEVRRTARSSRAASCDTSRSR